MRASANFIHLFRHGMMGKGLFFLLALYIFNNSVDFQDQRIAHYNEDITINEIESFAELIIEEIVCIDNFFEEQSESETEPTTKGATALNYLIPDPLILPIKSVEIKIHFYPGDIALYYPTDFSILTPPPQRV